MKSILIIPLLILTCLPASSAEETPKVVRDIIESVRPNVDKARQEYARKARIENDKIVAQIKKALETATKAGKFDEAIALKAAFEKAGNGVYLDEMINVSATDLLGDEEHRDGEVTAASRAALQAAGWKLQGAVEFCKDAEVNEGEVAILKSAALFKDNYEAIRNGPVFVSMWVKYEGGVGGSIFGIALENRDELSLLALGDGRLATYSGWPNARMAPSTIALAVGRWTYLGCQWDKAGMTLYLDGKEAGKVPVPALENRTGRLEIGVNSPGGDEYLNLSVGTIRVIAGKPVAPEAVARFMKSDSRLLK